jgi:hypothetical protein
MSMASVQTMFLIGTFLDVVDVDVSILIQKKNVKKPKRKWDK